MLENDTNFPDYITFGRTFEKYKWYKPVIVIIISAILYFVFQVILAVVFDVAYGEQVLNAVMNGGYETLNNSDASVYFSYLSIFAFLPSIYIASKIVRDRPFSSYSSSRGGWNWKLYFKCLAIPFVIYIVFSVISIIIYPESGSKSNVSLITMILSLILIPAQCIAEEYVFRGILMQTLGSWFKIPILAIIIQAILFAIGHSYNSLGVISVGISGILYGFLVWRTNGLEASSAIHSINNLMGFYVVALGLGSISSTLTVLDFVMDIFITVLSVALVYYIGNKKGWFSEKTADA